MGENVLADPQYGIARVLRPFAGFEGVYEGKSVIFPIAFSEGGQPLDPSAGQPGYSEKLVRGLSVPFGSRVTIYLPNIAGNKGLPATTFWLYQWQIVIRLRSTFDYRQNRIPYSITQSLGAPDTTTPGKEARVIIPASVNSILYTQTDPGLLISPTSFLTAERVAPEPLAFLPPLLPDGTNGVVQQGLLNPGTFPNLANLPLFFPYEIPAIFGNEILVSITRQSEPNIGTPSAEPNWQFTTGDDIDSILSDLFGNGSGAPIPSIGVYVFTGVAPGPGQPRNP